MPAHAQNPLVPQDILELGLTHAQPAFFVDAIIDDVDYDEFRRLAPSTRGMSNSQIDDLIMANVPVISFVQPLYNGIYHTAIEPAGNEDRFIYYQVNHYRRADIPIFRNRQEAVAQNVPHCISNNCLAIFGVKGVGISPSLELMALHRAQRARDMGLAVDLPETTPNQRALWQQDLQNFELWLINVKRDLSKASNPRVAASLTKDMHSADTLIQELRYYFSHLGRPPTQDTTRDFLNIVRGLDYADGMFRHPLGIREIATERVTRRVLAAHNAAHPRQRYSTTSNVFLLRLRGFKLLGVNGFTQDASLLGTAVHWRGPANPYAMPKKVGGSNFSGGIQASVNGGLVDFELIHLNDLPQVPRDMRSRTDASGQRKTAMDDIIEALSQIMQDGETDALGNWLSELLEPLQGIDPQAFSSRPHHNPAIKAMEALITKIRAQQLSNEELGGVIEDLFALSTRDSWERKQMILLLCVKYYPAQTVALVRAQLLVPVKNTAYLTQNLVVLSSFLFYLKKAFPQLASDLVTGYTLEELNQQNMLSHVVSGFTFLWLYDAMRNLMITNDILYIPGLTVESCAKTGCFQTTLAYLSNTVFVGHMVSSTEAFQDIASKALGLGPDMDIRLFFETHIGDYYDLWTRALALSLQGLDDGMARLLNVDVDGRPRPVNAGQNMSHTPPDPDACASSLM